MLCITLSRLTRYKHDDTLPKCNSQLLNKVDHEIPCSERSSTKTPSCRSRDSTSDLDNASKEGTTLWCRRCPFRQAKLKVPRVEGTTSTSVAVISFKQGFRLDTFMNPKIRQQRAILSHPWLHRSQTRSS
jgi:hypothetical protein